MRRLVSISEACLTSRRIGSASHFRKLTIILRCPLLPRSRKSAATPQALVPEADRSRPKPAFDLEAYNSVARAAKLTTIALRRSNFALDLEYYSVMNVEGRPEPRYSGAFANPLFDAQKGQA